jgi:hypothetical protein
MMTKHIKVFYLDNYGPELSPMQIAGLFSAPNRYVKIIYFDEPLLSDVELLRPLFELNTLQHLSREIAFERDPRFSEYFFIAYNCSIPYRLSMMSDRVDALRIYQRITRAFDLCIKHLCIHPPVSDQTVIGSLEFVKNLSNGVFYSFAAETSEKLSLYFNCIPNSDSYTAEITELSLTNRTKI